MALSLVDKVTAAPWSFVSVILNFVSPIAEEITQSLDQVKIRLMAFQDLQKLLKHFNETAILTSFVLPAI